jgi:hypothetical protein
LIESELRYVSVRSNSFRYFVPTELLCKGLQHDLVCQEVFGVSDDVYTSLWTVDDIVEKTIWPCERREWSGQATYQR